MTKLSIYEDREGHNKKIVSRYFREDYVSYHLMISFISITVGYLLLLVLYGLYFGEEMLQDVQDFDFITLGIRCLQFMELLPLLFLAVSYIVYTNRYEKSKKKLKSYHSGLSG